MTHYETIAAFYNRSLSLRETARHFGVSEYTIRRTLITMNVYESSRYNEIKDLLDRGLSNEQIASQLNINIHTVEGYRPYSKGSYALIPPTAKAIRIREWRRSKSSII